MLIIATGKYLGEGFDEVRLNTLFLTMPISRKVTLAQYAGRLHRLHLPKEKVLEIIENIKKKPIFPETLANLKNYDVDKLFVCKFNE